MMFTFYQEIRTSIPKIDHDEVAILMPSRADDSRIDEIGSRLRYLESIMVKFQSPTNTMADVTILFNVTIEGFPSTTRRLSAGDAIVLLPLLEKAILKYKETGLVDLSSE